MAKCPHGLIQTSTCFTPEQIDFAHALFEARKRHAPPGWEPKLCQVFQDVFTYGMHAFDRSTGWLKSPAQQPSGSGVLRIFECGRFASREQLFRAMNDSHLMLWACGAEMDNLHVTPMLEYYTGRPAAQFRRLGWRDLLHPEDREPTGAYCREQFQTRRQFLFQYRLQRFDGEYGSMVDFAQPCLLPDGEFAGYVGTVYQLPPGSAVLYMPEIAA
jgi:PAS domain-containing protein